MNDDQTSVHRETWQLIPWLVNGTASPGERLRGERHLAECADCREEFAAQMQIRTALVEATATTAPAPDAFTRLLARIDGEAGMQDAASPTPVARDAARRANAERWLPALVAAVVVQAIGLVALAAFAVQRAAPDRVPPVGVEAPYATLTSTRGPATGAVIRLVPATGIAFGSLARLLAENDLRIVEASDDNAILGLAASGPIDVETTVARLRLRADVLLAEPVSAPGGHAR